MMKFILLLLIILIVIAMLLKYYSNKAPFANVRIDELAIKLGRGASKLRIKNLKKHPRSKSEAEVIKYLEEITGRKFPTVYPKWLVWRGKQLELDGFDGKIALEFSGPLHTKWFPLTETYIDYFERIVRDIVKRRMCKRYNIPLIVVDASLPRPHWRNYILSRLYDFGIINDKPTSYIDEQFPEPFRNYQLESEMNLDTEIKSAMRL